MNWKILLPLFAPSLLPAADSIDPLRFEKEGVVSGCSDPLQLDIAPDGRLFFVERAGASKMRDPQSGRTVTVGTLPAPTSGDTGALGLALAPDFASSGHVYVYRVTMEQPPRIVLSRLTLQGEKLDAST